MAIDLKEYIASQLTAMLDDYVRDIDALPEDALGNGAVGTARVPYDFTYEVAHVNRRLAARLRGEDPGPSTLTGWAVAPEHLRSKEACLQDIKSSTQEVIDAWRILPDDQLGEVKGSMPAFELALFAVKHMLYHDAQLNYLQAARGDMEVHWA